MPHGFTLQDLLNGEHRACGYLLLGLAPATLVTGLALLLAH